MSLSLNSLVWQSLRRTSENSMRALRYTLALSLVSGLHAGCSPQSTPPQERLDDDDAMSASAPAPVGLTAINSFRAIGTEPFWGLIIDSAGLRFTTPDDTMGIRFPPITPSITSDTLHWTGETERATIDARIWPDRCSDGMSDRIWPQAAIVSIDGIVYRGCAEPLSPALLGEWVVVDHRIPGISAMDDSEAAEWNGRSVRFGTEEAISDAVPCRDPRYHHRRAPADSLLADFHITPSHLGLDTPELRLGFTEVFCGSTRWAALGGLLIWIEEDRPYAPFDGVFFELRRAGT
jgi:uncharacterized membrane protein